MIYLYTMAMNEQFVRHGQNELSKGNLKGYEAIESLRTLFNTLVGSDIVEELPVSPEPTPSVLVEGITNTLVQSSDSEENSNDAAKYGLTNLEEQLYNLMQGNVYQIVDKPSIKRALWGDDNLKTDSAVQKLIERIRSKIENDFHNPRRLIAVKGKGYLFRG